MNYLMAHQGSATWLVAVSGSNTAAPVQIETGRPVPAMGGFAGEDEEHAMTVEKLSALVRAGRLRYVYDDASGIGAMLPNGRTGNAVTGWVKQHGTAVNYGGSDPGTLYDLSPAATR